jgi:hypothetical protein
MRSARDKTKREHLLLQVTPKSMLVSVRTGVTGVEVRSEQEQTCLGPWRCPRSLRSAGRPVVFFNRAVEEITLSHSTATLPDAPYLPYSSSFPPSSSSSSPDFSSLYACAY